VIDSGVVTPPDALALLRALDEGVARQTGASFFAHLVCSLAKTLSAHCAFVSEIDRVGYRVQVLSIWHQGRFAETFSYELAGTPCECVLDNRIVAFPRRVQDLFPEDREGLARYQAESFLAIPLCDARDQVRGHIAVLDCRERDWSEVDLGILRIFSARAGAELERRDYERQLQSANDALERANMQLRQELVQRQQTETQLAEANRVAERARQVAEDASQAKSNFLAQMSHELRTPLNGILGYAQLLQRDPTLGAEQLEGVGVIERAGEHLLTLINDLLDLAKIEAGRLELQQAPVDLAGMLRQVADVTRLRARQAGLTFETQLPPELPRGLIGDERALKQVLLNLLSNAVKFTPRGAILLRLGVSDQIFAAPDRVDLRFTVEDSGTGIAEAQLAQIFEPFVRGEGVSRVEGAGLGLAITRRLLDAMGGRIEVRSKPGEGTCFTVELALIRSAKAGADLLPGPIVRRRIIGHRGLPRRVLVVDDDTSNRAVLSGLLTSVGLSVVQAPEAQAALQVLTEEHIDLLATDLAMPAMNGLELARRARAETGRGENTLKILAVSASASAFTREEALAAGCDAFIAKPVHAQELYDRVAELLQLTWETTVTTAEAAESARSDGLDGLATRRIDPRRAAELRDLAMKGDVKELLERAQMAITSDIANEAVYREIHRLARQYDMRAVRRVLDDSTQELA
jgi:signal transduction histidine kinase/DNA-binding response OmpR family regulator